MNPSPFQDLVYMSRTVLNEVAQIKEYSSWSDEFSRRMAIEALEKFHKRVGEAGIDILNLSKDELFTLGFGNWGDDILLIPLYLLPCIPTGTKVYGIMGGEKTIGIDELDNDVRFGCVSYGIKFQDEEAFTK